MKFSRNLFFAGTMVVLPALIHAFSAKDIVSPSPGLWANRQPLVLNTDSDTDVFYSVSGSDPLVSGFAYDVPVLIDIDGDVRLSLVAVDKNTGNQERFEVDYSVRESAVDHQGESGAFLREISENPVKKYISGTVFSFPDGISHSLNDDDRFYDSDLRLSGKNILSRYVPCSLAIGDEKYHFVIHVVPARGIEQNLRFPFSVSDWNRIQFSSDDFLFCIDDGEWISGNESVVVDRDRNHLLSWRRVDEPDSFPTQMLLPMKPQIYSTRNADSQIAFTIRGDKGYSLQVADGVADVFEGEFVSGHADLPVFLSGMYQGTISVFYAVDRQAPPEPEILPQTELAAGNNERVVRIKGEIGLGNKIFYAVSAPVVSDEGFSSSSDPSLADVEKGTFAIYGNEPLVLKAVDGKATYYRITAFSEDDFANRSREVEYGLVIDDGNFYLSQESTSRIHDGTFANPFVGFSEAVDAVNRSSCPVKLHVSGNVRIEGGEQKITSDCTVIGDGSILTVEGDAFFSVENSSFSVKNLVIEKRFSNYSALNLFVLRNSTVDFSECDFSGIFRTDGILIDASDSVLNLDSLTFMVQASSYSCALTLKNSRTKVRDCRFTAVSPTCVNCAFQGGSCEIENSVFTLVGSMGRIIELLGTEASLSGNRFHLSLPDGAKKNADIWKDTDSVLLKYENNVTEGF